MANLFRVFPSALDDAGIILFFISRFPMFALPQFPLPRWEVLRAD